MMRRLAECAYPTSTHPKGARHWDARSPDGLPARGSSGLCSKLCSDRVGSRRIRRHRTELRSWDYFRKLGVSACFVGA
jgi:hypothetical protein